MRVAAAAVVAAVAHAAAAAAAAIAQYIYFVTYYDITRSSYNTIISQLLQSHGSHDESHLGCDYAENIWTCK